METASTTNQVEAQVPWDRLATRARWMGRAQTASIYGFLIAVSVPLIMPYIWMVTVAFSSKTGTVDTLVLWRSMAVLIPFVLSCWIWSTLARNIRQTIYGFAAITLVATAAFVAA